MKLLKRIGFYLIGVSLGSIVVLFIWKGKDVTFDYGPDARTLKSIRKKVITYSETAKSSMQELNLDSIAIQTILYKGDVNFGKSKPRQKPCAEYFITGKHNKRKINLYVTRCDSIATIDKVSLQD